MMILYPIIVIKILLKIIWITIKWVPLFVGKQMDCCHVGKQKVVDLVNQKRMTWTVRDLLVGVAGKMRKRFIALTKTVSFFFFFDQNKDSLFNFRKYLVFLFIFGAVFCGFYFTCYVITGPCNDIWIEVSFGWAANKYPV